MTKLLLQALIHLRWAYFHISPFYQRFYMDESRTEAHFFHAHTNSIHSNYYFRSTDSSGKSSESNHE